MILVCELFTDEPEGGMATVPYSEYTNRIRCPAVSKFDLSNIKTIAFLQPYLLICTYFLLKWSAVP